jgi:hypothetical protein
MPVTIERIIRVRERRHDRVRLERGAGLQQARDERRRPAEGGALEVVVFAAVDANDDDGIGHPAVAATVGFDGLHAGSFDAL